MERVLWDKIPSGRVPLDATRLTGTSFFAYQAFHVIKLRNVFATSPALSVSSKNSSLKRNKPITPTIPTSFLPAASPTSSSADNQLDFLLKSLAKETMNGMHRDEARNEAKADGGLFRLFTEFVASKVVTISRLTRVELTSCLFSCVLDAEVELLTKSLNAEIPNNISKFSSSFAKPIPPSQLKCNILKGKCMLSCILSFCCCL